MEKVTLQYLCFLKHVVRTHARVLLVRSLQNYCYHYRTRALRHRTRDITADDDSGVNALVARNTIENW